MAILRGKPIDLDRFTNVFKAFLLRCQSLAEARPPCPLRNVGDSQEWMWENGKCPAALVMFAKVTLNVDSGYLIGTAKRQAILPADSHDWVPAVFLWW